MRVILLLGGAFLGFVLGSESEELLGTALGAFAGYVIAELVAARRRIKELESHVGTLLEAAWRERQASQLAAAEQSRPARVPEPSPASASRDAELPAAARDEAAAEQEIEADASPADPYSERAPDVVEPVQEQAAPARSYQSEDLPIVRLIREYFTGGNTLVRVGVIILFIGMAFLLRYVAERTSVPIEFRLAGVALAGIVLLALGWRLRKKREGYALALQGGAIGILYLTVFTALRLFDVMSPGPAFALLIAISALSAALAVLQNSMALSLLAIGCGFLAPVLASTGQGNHVALFSYYIVLNLGILAIAWFKAWRPLNVVGFLFTFVIATAWGVTRYQPANFATTEPFLIAFFLLYVAIAVLFSLRQQPSLRGYVDGTLVFGVPVVAFGLQSGLVHDRPFAMAYSALAASALYIALAWLLHRGKRDTQRLLVEAFMALGVVFATLAVPLALDGRWSAATWALEGAALVWIGCRQGRRLPRTFGALLQFAGGVIFLFDVAEPYGAIPVLNSACLGGVMIAFASVFASHTLRKSLDQLAHYERPFIAALFLWGLLWWLASGLTEIYRHVPDAYIAASILPFLTATALLSSELHRRLPLEPARLPPFALLPLMVVFAIMSALGLNHPLVDGGWLSWPVVFAGFYFLLRRNERQDVAVMPQLYHAAAALLLISLLAWEFAWQIDEAVRGGGSWPAIGWAVVPALALLFLPKLCERVAWPFATHQETYVLIVGGLVSIYLALWSVFTNLTMPGDPFPLPYIPLLNPLDLAQAFVLVALAGHALHLHKANYALVAEFGAPRLIWAMAVLLFIWLNAILLRTLHHWYDIPYEPDALFSSTLVQTALTIFWTVLALATMLFATRRSARVVWIVGACLMAVVIAKLFLIDLSRIGTVERIVSFVGVGVLMLVVGYFSPLPPARREAAA
jgi:uncharacterized membrane protein